MTDRLHHSKNMSLRKPAPPRAAWTPVGGGRGGSCPAPQRRRRLSWALALVSPTLSPMPGRCRAAGTPRAARARGMPTLTANPTSVNGASTELSCPETHLLWDLPLLRDDVTLIKGPSSTGTRASGVPRMDSQGASSAHCRPCTPRSHYVTKERSQDTRLSCNRQLFLQADNEH